MLANGRCPGHEHTVHDRSRGAATSGLGAETGDWKRLEIAEALGVTEGAVSQWMKRGREGGRDALRYRPPPGAEPKLSAEQWQQVLGWLVEGAEAHGFRGEIWNCPRVARLIERKLGVSYHPAHLCRVLRQLGWSLQKPMRRAAQRDEAAIEAWRTQRWPALKRGRRPAARRSSS